MYHLKTLNYGRSKSMTMILATYLYVITTNLSSSFKILWKLLDNMEKPDLFEKYANKTPRWADEPFEDDTVMFYNTVCPYPGLRNGTDKGGSMHDPDFKNNPKLSFNKTFIIIYIIVTVRYPEGYFPK
ncbi:8013_t:CDS:1 [Funneliformis mosseae]|uniref:8013_t:CDS:1 n=1 Tax=Funneliformis mosseae TaxID=27381 RepID=A0A9N9D2Y2_FUNMO|nr:8013_t:CDS:1 [Funneliformis mosseae]